jgi:uncharacterized protein (TIGR02217 family)
VSIQILTDVIVPNSLWSVGVQGRQIRRNARAQSQSGVMAINIIWSHTLRQYTFGSVPLTIDQWQTLEGLYEVTDAGAYGFLAQDPKDFTADDTTGKLSLISGTTYQLLKRYTSIGSAQYRDRTIRHVKAVGFVLKLSGTPLTLTSDYTFNADTGVVTIPSTPAAANLSWSGLFYVPIHFASDEIEWELVAGGSEDQRYLAGPQIVFDEVRE